MVSTGNPSESPAEAWDACVCVQAQSTKCCPFMSSKPELTEGPSRSPFLHAQLLRMSWGHGADNRQGV